MTGHITYAYQYRSAYSDIRYYIIDVYAPSSYAVESQLSFEDALLKLEQELPKIGEQERGLSLMADSLRAKYLKD